MKYVYNTNGRVCAQFIEIEVENDCVKSVNFIGGCDGNHKGIAQLAVGMDINEVIQRLSGITCGMRSTSCPDQLAQALSEYRKQTR